MNKEICFNYSCLYIIHDSKNKKKRSPDVFQPIDNKIQKEQEKEEKKTVHTHTHIVFVSDKSLFYARLIFNNNDNESKKNLLVFSKMFLERKTRTLNDL